VDGYHYICPQCLREIDWIRCHFCPRCSAPDIEFPDEKGCESCRGKKFAFRSNRSIYAYGGLGRQMIHELKYRNGRYLLPDMGQMTREFSLNLHGALLVPVPLHWFRRWMRGFNQSELLCGQLARFHDCEVCSLLRRRRHTTRQVGLGIRARQRNVEGAFEVNKRMLEKKNIAPNRKIVLVDDIFTTGSTLHACASSLAAAGFMHIETLTLARA
jgi:ComF family protein